MTVPRLLEMAEYWKQFPPLQEAFAQFIGLKPSPATPTTDGNDNDELINDLMAAGFTLPPAALG